MSLFTLDPAPTFSVTVELTAPGGEKRSLPMTFKHMGKARLQEWRKQIAARPADDEPAILAEVIADWQADTPYTADALARLLDNHHRAGEEIYLAYLQGLAGARLGN
jgi:hypothetical protein